MRVLHLAILKYAYCTGGAVGLKRAYYKLQDPNLMVLHNCGCGLGFGCCEPTHLRFGTQNENEEDKHYHFVLEKAYQHGNYFDVRSQIASFANFNVI